jgi:ABC-type phosphate transport system substrate-binding protein
MALAGCHAGHKHLTPADEFGLMFATAWQRRSHEPLEEEMGAIRSSIGPLGLLTPALALASLQGTADAHLFTPQCEGIPAFGVGSSLQQAAHYGSDFSADATGWAYAFSHASNSVCPVGGLFDPQPTYHPLGSHAALAAMCSDGVNFTPNPDGNAFDPSYDFAATDLAPTPGEIANMNSCQGAVRLPLAIHTIPVAQAAIAVIVHLPTGCTINSNDHASTENRLDITNSALERVFFGDSNVTWSTLLPSSPSCAGSITRVVPYDPRSGTAFAFAEYLNQIRPQDSWDALARSNYQPSRWSDSSTNLVYGGATSSNPPGTCPLPPPFSETIAEMTRCNGDANLAQSVRDTPGSVGFVDMATAVHAGFQYPAKGSSSTFWVPLQNNGTSTKGATFADPNATSDGYIDGNSTGGADCATASYTPPAPPTGSADSTLSSWSNVIGSSPSATPTYPICALTYELAFDDPSLAYGDTTILDEVSRTVKDYLEYILSNAGANDGQSVLRPLGYDALPANILAVARTGADAITWSGRF